MLTALSSFADADQSLFRYKTAVIVDAFEHALGSRHPRFWIRRLFRVLVGLCLGLCLSLCTGGCAAATLAAFGTFAGGVSTAASAGVEVWGWGKLDTAEMTSFDDAIAAAKSAAEDLRLRPEPRKEHRKSTARESLVFFDDKGARTTVIIERRSPMLTYIGIHVGIFGSESTARLFLTRLRAHLPRGQTAQTQTAPSSREVEVAR